MNNSRNSAISVLRELENNNNNNFDKIYNDNCKLDTYIPAILPKTSRIVVIGDIHGDLDMAIKILYMANLIKFIDTKVIKWCGGSTVVVQVGDQIDRCRPTRNSTCQHSNTTFKDEASDIKILKLFSDLHKNAVKKGGAVISLLGNHELMNSMGYLDYVSHEGLKQFEGYKDPNDPTRTFKSGRDARSYAFAPGNEYGKLLGCTRLPAVIIGSNLFVHAGLVDGLINHIGLNGIDDFEVINKSIRKWLLGLLETKYIEKIINSSTYSMFWTRILGKIPSQVPKEHPICSTNISKVLKLFKVNGIIIGHTPQSFMYNDDVNSTCDGHVWRIDNASSKAFHKFDKTFLDTGTISHSRRLQYLEIIDDTTYNICDNKGCKLSYTF